MKKTINTFEGISSVAKIMLGKANHHAPHVEHLVSCLCGLVLAKADPGSVKISEREIRGETHIGTQVWFAIKGTTFKFVYNHHTKQILLKEGHNVHCFVDEKTNLLELFKILEGYAAGVEEYADGGAFLLT